MEGLYHLAQVNIALLREPIDSELLQEFVSELDHVNPLRHSHDRVAVALLELSVDRRDLARDVAERAAAKETTYVAWKARAAAIVERCLAADATSDA
jgi:chorismate mutase